MMTPRPNLLAARWWWRMGVRMRVRVKPRVDDGVISIRPRGRPVVHMRMRLRLLLVMARARACEHLRRRERLLVWMWRLLGMLGIRVLVRMRLGLLMRIGVLAGWRVVVTIWRVSHRWEERVGHLARSTWWSTLGVHVHELMLVLGSGSWKQEILVLKRWGEKGCIPSGSGVPLPWLLRCVQPDSMPLCQQALHARS